MRWRGAQRALRQLAIGSPEHTEVAESIGGFRRAYLAEIQRARQDRAPEPPQWPMMSPRSQSSLPVISLVIDNAPVSIESGWLTIVEQESGRRDWHVNVLFAEIHLERRGAEEVKAVISTPSGVLRGRAIVTGNDPFGMTLAAAPSAADVWQREDAD